MPRLQVFYDSYGANGFVPVAVNLSEDPGIVLQYARLYTYPFLRDNGSVWGTYRQNNLIPLNYVIGPDGIIRYVAEGFNEPAIDEVIRQYLPGPIDHDVGVRRLIAPTGNVDSAASVVPACSVYNRGENTESYPVRMKIGAGYNETVTVTGHTPGTSRYVEFPAWSAAERGPLTVSCSTELADDDVPYNDRATGRVTVNVYDLAVTAILVPGDSVDSAATVVPAVEVRNLGTVADMARVRFAIGTGYQDSTNVPLQPGRCDTATFAPWTPHQLGTFSMRCSVSGRWEMVPENNVLTGTVRVLPTGIEETSGLPVWLESLSLSPNPAGRRLTIGYALRRSTEVDLRIYAADGRLVRLLRDGREPAGEHAVVWEGLGQDGRPVRPGVYYCRLDADGQLAVRKFTKAE